MIHTIHCAGCWVRTAPSPLKTAPLMGTGAAAVTPVLSAPGNNNQTTQYKSTPFSGGFSVQNEAFLLYLTRVSLVFWYYKGLFWFYLESLLVSVCMLSPWQHAPTTTCVCLAKRYLSHESSDFQDEFISIYNCFGGWCSHLTSLGQPCFCSGHFVCGAALGDAACVHATHRQPCSFLMGWRNTS